MKMRVLTRVQTNLLYNGKVIPDSGSDKEVYTRVTSESFYIYLTMVEPKLVYTLIVEGILDLLKRSSIEFDANTTLYLVSIFENLPEETPEILDTVGVPCDATDQTISYMPKPGELVPQQHYCLLKSNFEKFNIGDYVAVWKNYDDDEYYVYAIIAGYDNKNDEKDISQRIYYIQINENPDNIVKVKGFDLFQFDRMNPLIDRKEFVKLESVSEEESVFDTSQNFEEVIEEIRKTLKSMASVDENSKKKIIKRLYLKWYPDKHDEKTREFATKVFQFLLNELNSKHQEFEDEFDNWASQARIHASFQNTFYRNFRDYPSTRSNNPQPSESKRWYKQAKKDLEAAIELANV